MLLDLPRARPGEGPPRLRVASDDPIGLATLLRAEADRTLIAGTGWNLRRRQVLVVPRPSVPLAAVLRHLGELGVSPEQSG